MSHNELKIHIYPHEVLFNKNEDITTFDENLIQLSKNMLELMYETNGVGLAAPQVGINKKMLVIDTVLPNSGQKPEPLVFINPKITKKGSNFCSIEEGCLSLPTLYYNIERPDEIELEYQDIKGQKHKKIFKDDNENYKKTKDNKHRMARILQHEIDHLEGKVFIDHLSKLKKDMATKKLAKAIKKWQEEDN
ncbi:MAG: peptide deformylase [Rickettsiales bacterium]|jgi:peptide deformylase|nr:peptide deformylase [Rickettsiales bacterium]